jgi:hypothetical protein
MEIKEVSLYYDYYETIIHKNQFEKTFQNGGYIKVPFINNRSLTEPNIIISDENSSIKYRSENIYITHNVHKIPFYSNKSKYDVLPILNEEDDTRFSNGELIIEHTPLTNTDKKIYTVFLLKTRGCSKNSGRSEAKENSKDNDNMIDKLIKKSFNTNDGRNHMNSPAEPLYFTLNDLLLDETKSKCLTNNDKTVFIFKTPIICTSLQEIAAVATDDPPLNIFGSQNDNPNQDHFLFPVYKKNEYKNHKVIIQTPQTHVLFGFPSLRSGEAMNYPGNSMGRSPKENSFSSVRSEDESLNKIGIETFDNGIVYDDDDGKTNGQTASTNLKVTDNLQLVCNDSGLKDKMTVKNTEDKFNYLLVIGSLIFMIFFFYLAILCFQHDFRISIILLNAGDIKKISSTTFSYTDTVFMFIFINFLIILPSFTLLISWMTELFIIGCFWMLGSIFTIFLNYNNFVEYKDINNPTKYYENEILDDNLYNYITKYNQFIGFIDIFLIIANLVFFSYSISNIGKGPDDKYYFFNAERYVNYKYPGKYWSVLPPCKFDSGETVKGYLIEDKNSTMNCSDFKKMRMSQNNRELAGVFFSVPILLYLFLYRPLLNILKYEAISIIIIILILFLVYIIPVSMILYYNTYNWNWSSIPRPT